MKQEELNDELYNFLLKIQKSPETLIDENISENEFNLYKYLIQHNLVDGLQVEYYYSGPTVNASQAIITKYGYDFIKEVSIQKSPIRMSRKNRHEQLQMFLQRLDDGDKELIKPNPRVRDIDYYDLIKFAIKQNLVSGIDIYYADDEAKLLIRDDARVTTDGYDILDLPVQSINSSKDIEQHYHFYDGDYRQSTFGSGNTQNNV